MSQDFSRSTAPSNLSELNRLVAYIGQHSVDSEQVPITPEEIPIVTNQLLRQLIWNYPCLDELLQELLDELRFRVSKDVG